MSLTLQLTPPQVSAHKAADVVCESADAVINFALSNGLPDGPQLRAMVQQIMLAEGWQHRTFTFELGAGQAHLDAACIRASPVPGNVNARRLVAFRIHAAMCVPPLIEMVTRQRSRARRFLGIKYGNKNIWYQEAVPRGLRADEVNAIRNHLSFHAVQTADQVLLTA